MLKKHWEFVLQNEAHTLHHKKGNEFKVDLKRRDLGNLLLTIRPHPERYDQIINEIKAGMAERISPNFTVLELGSWDGIWTRYLL